MSALDKGPPPEYRHHYYHWVRYNGMVLPLYYEADRWWTPGNDEPLLASPEAYIEPAFVELEVTVSPEMMAAGLDVLQQRYVRLADVDTGERPTIVLDVERDTSGEILAAVYVAMAQVRRKPRER